MLDLGFEKEMNQCLELIKQKSPGNFDENQEKTKHGKSTFFSNDM